MRSEDDSEGSTHPAPAPVKNPSPPAWSPDWFLKVADLVESVLSLEGNEQHWVDYGGKSCALIWPILTRTIKVTFTATFRLDAVAMTLRATSPIASNSGVATSKTVLQMTLAAPVNNDLTAFRTWFTEVYNHLDKNLDPITIPVKDNHVYLPDFKLYGKVDEQKTVTAWVDRVDRPKEWVVNPTEPAPEMPDPALWILNLIRKIWGQDINYRVHDDTSQHWNVTADIRNFPIPHISISFMRNADKVEITLLAEVSEEDNYLDTHVTSLGFDTFKHPTVETDLTDFLGWLSLAHETIKYRLDPLTCHSSLRIPWGDVTWTYLPDLVYWVQIKLSDGSVTIRSHQQDRPPGLWLPDTAEVAQLGFPLGSSGTEARVDNADDF